MNSTATNNQQSSPCITCGTMGATYNPDHRMRLCPECLAKRNDTFPRLYLAFAIVPTLIVGVLLLIFLL